MVLSASQYLGLLAAEAAQIVLPAGPRRRVATGGAYQSVLDDAQRDLSLRQRYVAADGPNISPAERRDDAERAMELASLLYSAGAPHSSWRRWAALTSVGLLLAGECPADAAVWAVLSRDRGLIHRLPPAVSVSKPHPAEIIHRLATRDRAGGADDGPHQEPTDQFDRHWFELGRSIPVGDHRRIEAALRAISDHWIQELEDGDQFHAHSYPDFDPESNAAATLAAAAGWSPQHLDDAERAFLEPGLVPGEPEPLAPDLLPPPSAGETMEK